MLSYFAWCIICARSRSRTFLRVCTRALSQRGISRTSRPTTWFNSHAFLSRLPSSPPCCRRSRLFSPPFPVVCRSLLPPYLHLARLRVAGPVPSFLARPRRPNPDRRFSQSPWPNLRSLRPVGSLTIFTTSRRSPNTNTRSLGRSSARPNFLLITSRNGERRDRALTDRPCERTLKKEETETPLAPRPPPFCSPLRDDFAFRLSRPSPSPSVKLRIQLFTARNFRLLRACLKLQCARAYQN